MLILFFLFYSLNRKSEVTNENYISLLKAAKFCHECGVKYPIADVKFCTECGMRRIISWLSRISDNVVQNILGKL